jgi:hypothetical protein
MLFVFASSATFLSGETKPMPSPPKTVIVTHIGDRHHVAGQKAGALVARGRRIRLDLLAQAE